MVRRAHEQWGSWGKAGSLATLLAVLMSAASPVGAQEERRTLIVSASGSGDHSSISDALAAASDGDTIVVMPGTYEEALDIDRAVTVIGDGSPTRIVLSWGQADPPVLRLSGTTAEVSNLTIDAPGSFVHVVGGAPVLADLRLKDVGSAMDLDACHALIGPDSCNAVAVRVDGGSPSIERSVFDGPGGIFVSGGAAPVVTGNVMFGGAHVFLEEIGEGTIVRRNSFTEPQPFGIALYGSGAPLLEGNFIERAGTSGIDVGLHRQPGIEPHIRDNVVSDSPTGIQLHQDANAVVEENELAGNGTGIVVTGSDARLDGNDLAGNATGIFVLQGSPVLGSNVISGGTVGLGLGSDRASPVLSDNAICDNETNINLLFGAEMPDLSAERSCP